jgi:hypothetical protein
VFTSGLTAESTKESGNLENNTEKANIFSLMGLLRWGSGKMEKELNGLMTKAMKKRIMMTKNDFILSLNL